MILLDGQPCDSPLLLDRGLAYGDGLFETLAVRDGEPLAWSAHMARLARGCAVLGLPSPDTQALWDDTRRVLPTRPRGVLKIVMTRGTGGRGYRPLATAQSRRIVSLHPWPEDLDTLDDQPLATWVCRQRLGHQPQLAGIKHLNRLEQVLASAEWPAPHYFEGLMLDGDGHLIEGTRSNLFLVHGDTLSTPDLSRCGIAGVVREAVLDCASSHGLTPRVAPLTFTHVAACDEMFLCNSVMGLRAVGQVDHGADTVFIAHRGVARHLAVSLRTAGVIP